jgi:hypothetical protein
MTRSFATGLIFAVLAMVLGVCSCAQAEETANWHLMTKTHKGTISLLHGLEKKTCEFARHRALGQPATEEEEAREKEYREIAYGQPCPLKDADEKEWKEWMKQHPGAYGCFSADLGGSISWGPNRYTSDSDVETAECFQ